MNTIAQPLPALADTVVNSAPTAAAPVSTAPSNDPVLRDSWLAAKLFAAGTAALLLGAALGLNSWPAQQIVVSALSGSGKDLFVAFHGYALVLLVLFWGSRPKRHERWLSLGAGAVISFVLWRMLDHELDFAWADPKGFPILMLLAVAFALPAVVFLVWRSVRVASADDVAFDARLRLLFVLALLFMMVPQPALSLTATLHPLTFDIYAMHWDAAAGIGVTPALVGFIDAVPGLPQLVTLAYGMTPLGFLAVALLHLRGRPVQVPSALLMWVGLTCCALLAYNLMPITGPKYAFGSDHYVAKLREATQLPVAYVQVNFAPRNGMPSMHFGWMLAASILWWRSGTRWWSRAILIAMTTLTALATLYNGEHYTIDLVVAVPFVLAAMALSTTSVPWSSRARRNTVLAGFGAWLVWVLLLRLQIDMFLEHRWLCWVMLAATALVVWQQARWIGCLRIDAVLLPADASPATARSSQARALTREQQRYGLMFFVSGMAALVYQVLFAKELALVFGSTATATLTVLATFLGGMAIGSVIGGFLAHRLARPLIAYAGVEVAIALYCVATPVLFKLIQSGYVAAATGLPPDAPMLLPLRVALGAFVLLVPTVLMGTTLPLLAQATSRHGDHLGSRVAWLYFANTAGAALGALLTAYFVIPAVGAHRTTLIAAMLNLMAALGAIELFKATVGGAATATTGAATAGMPPAQRSISPRLRWAALLALGIGGVLSLGLEVVYVHMLSIVAGNSVYAFGLMVATFLVGLSAGGEAARRLLLRPTHDPAAALTAALLGLGASVALGGMFWNGIPEYFGSYAGYPAARTFASREAIRGLVCALVMIPPTLFIGATYVLAMDIVTTGGDAKKTIALGMGAAVNTVGNIAGVLLFGFVVLPAIGGLQSGQIIAAAALLLAGLVALMGARIRMPVIGAAVAALGVFWLGARAQLDYDALSTGSNVYFSSQRWGKVIDYAESIDGGLTTVAEADTPRGKVRTLLTNGKFQGNDALGGEMQAQIGFALAPLLHQERRERALVIGYGTGVTSRVFHEAGFREVDVAELNGDIVRMADRYFGRVNGHASQAPGVRLHVTDGRNLLLLTPQRYDVISLEITSIWFAGAASLYKQEFYRLARSKLEADGVLQQWVQLHRLSPVDILHIIGSIRAEFSHVSLYVLGGQGVLVATNSSSRAEWRPDAVAALKKSPQLAEVRNILGRDVETIRTELVLAPQGVARYLAEVGVDPRLWVSTDVNLRLEYDTPKANVNDAEKSFKANFELLRRFGPQAR